MNNLYTEAALDAFRTLSDSLLTDTCTIYCTGSADRARPVVNNQGGTSKAVTATYQNIPCRVDVNVNQMLPQHNKDGIEADKIMRIIYISRDSLVSMQYIPKALDQIATSAGNILGNETIYRILEADSETDAIDYEMLVEIIPSLIGI